MAQRDPLLVRILLGGLLGALPKSRVDDVAAVLYDMLHVSSSAIVILGLPFQPPNLQLLLSWSRGCYLTTVQLCLCCMAAWLHLHC